MAHVPDDTICAIATPRGEGGIGIVRISGANALAVAARVVRLRSGGSLDSLPSHTLHLADIVSVSSERAGAGCEVLDEALAVYMRGPHSYTAEDVVELHCHGSSIVLARICEACVAAGARLAEPGEFTKRAFLNGRIDLSQAEAVLDTIRAKSEEGLRIAQRHLRGELGRSVEQLRGELVGVLAQVEAGIDFADEGIEVITPQDLLRVLQRTRDSVAAMLQSCRRGRVMREGARVVLRGRPNVGKSSVLNRLLEMDRAIVASRPGTTRDILEETCVLGGVPVTLVDTAGLRDAEDEVEREGIQRARDAQAEADLLLHVMDATYPEELSSWRGSEDATPSIVVVNKIDLLAQDRVAEVVQEVRRRGATHTVPMSALTGQGVEELRAGIRDCLVPERLESSDSVVVTNVRHRAALEQATLALEQACESVRNQVSADCVAVDLRAAADALGEITGAITSAEVLERIFSEFCIGK